MPLIRYFITIFILLTLAHGAHAQEEEKLSPEVEATLIIYNAGKEHFKAGRYQKAAEHFAKAARVLSNNPGIEYYLGRSLSELNRCEEALVHLAIAEGKLGDDAIGLEAERLRSLAAAKCTFRLAENAMKVFRCHVAKGRLDKLKTDFLSKKKKASARTMLNVATRCAERFDTSVPKGQEAARLYQQAQGHLDARRFKKAIATANASSAAQHNEPAHLVLGLALARGGNCEEALTHLETVPKIADAREQKARQKALRDCRLSEARRLTKANDCQLAMPLLRALKGQLRGSDARWLKQKSVYCDPRSTEFFTDTPSRKAAYKLYRAARKALAKKRLDLAVERYNTALELADVPLIRRELAEIHIHRGHCDAAVTSINGVPKAERVPKDEAIELACDSWAASRQLDSKKLAEYIQVVEEALKSLKNSDVDGAIAGFQAAWKIGRNPGALAGVVDASWLKGCEAWRLALKQARSNVRPLVADPQTREEQCQNEGLGKQETREAKKSDRPEKTTEAPPTERTDDKEKAPAEVAATDPAHVTTTEQGLDAYASEPGISAGAIAGWSTIGLGAASLGASLGFLVDYLAAVDEANAHVQDYSTVAVFEAYTAYERYTKAQQRADLNQTLSIALGVGGIVTALGGALLLILDAAPEASSEKPALSFEPIFTPESISMMGRF